MSNSVLELLKHAFRGPNRRRSAAGCRWCPSTVSVESLESRALLAVATTVSVSVSTATSFRGDKVILKAQVTAENGADTGVAIFNVYDGPNRIAIVGTRKPLEYAFTKLSEGKHDLRVVFQETDKFARSEASVEHTVLGKQTTRTSLVVPAGPSVEGQPFNITMSVVGDSGRTIRNPIFNVFDGADRIAIVAGGGNGGPIQTSIPHRKVGTHAIRVVFQGNDENQPSEATAEHVVTNKPGTVVSVTADKDESAPGEGVTLTMSVMGVNGIRPVNPIYNIYDGADRVAIVGTGNNPTGSVTLKHLKAGVHTLRVSFQSDSRFAEGSASVTHEVTTTPKRLAPVISFFAPGPSAAGQPVTFVAQVSSKRGTPTGKITFMNGRTVLGDAALVDGKATLTTASLPIGRHADIKAVYQGDSRFDRAVQRISDPHVVNKAASRTQLTTASAKTFGEAVTLKVTVQSVSGGAKIPAGEVRILDGNRIVGKAVLNSSGESELRISGLTAILHTLTAEYLGDNTFSPSRITGTQMVTKASSAIVLSSANNPVAVGTPLEVSARVTGNGTSLIGSVTFFDGSTVIGTAKLENGLARLRGLRFTQGTHKLKAVFQGNQNFSGSTSQVLDQLVSATEISNTILTSSSNPVKSGEAVTFRAKVQAETGGPVPLGTVKFYDNGDLLETVPLDATGVATFSSAEFVDGSHTILAVYSGDTTYRPSQATLTQLIDSSQTLQHTFSLDQGTGTSTSPLKFKSRLTAGGVSFDAELVVKANGNITRQINGLGVTNSVSTVPTAAIDFGESLSFSLSVSNVVGGTVNFDKFTLVSVGSLVGQATLTDGEDMALDFVTIIVPGEFLLTPFNRTAFSAFSVQDVSKFFISSVTAQFTARA